MLFDSGSDRLYNRLYLKQLLFIIKFCFLRASFKAYSDCDIHYVNYFQTRVTQYYMDKFITVDKKNKLTDAGVISISKYEAQLHMVRNIN